LSLIKATRHVQSYRVMGERGEPGRPWQIQCDGPVLHIRVCHWSREPYALRAYTDASEVFVGIGAGGRWNTKPGIFTLTPSLMTKPWSGWS